jgi:murein DD-endopeptidase MepM/ murein hydrolase activator NlpD
MGVFIITLILLNTFIIAYTPLKELIPGYPSSEMMQNIQNNAIFVNKLETEINLRDKYIAMLKMVVAGEVPDSFDIATLKNADTTRQYKNIVFSTSKEDSLLRMRVENEDKFSLSIQPQEASVDLKKLIFFNPVKGIITSQFEPSKKHYGIDVVSKPGEMVSAALDGIVLYSSYSMETGNVVIIQHRDNILTIYKHLARILKTSGNRVKSGEAIGVLGNSGEYTTGPHLHFEIWYKGSAINPADYIVF